MKDKSWLLWAGFGLGAGLMYMLDPATGRRRRKELAHRVASTGGSARIAAGKTARDVAHRAQGLAARARSLFRPEPADDAILLARVRSRLGRVVSHPHAVQVSVREGQVLLQGPILSDEVERLIRAVRRVPGVVEVIDELERHDTPGDVPSLQGGARRTGDRVELRQTDWMPAMRLVAAAAGGGLVLFGLRRRGPIGTAAAGSGLALLARGAGNRSLRQLVGLRGGGHVVSVHKTLHVGRPLEEVFGFWTRLESFPIFMSTLREVRDLGDGRTRWVVDGPAGVPASWEAEVIRLEPLHEIAWRTVPGSIVRNGGKITFERGPDGGTQVDIELGYDPPAGALGHLVAKLFGADPKSQMDEDLMRMKTFLETGRLPHDARARVETPTTTT